jgi:YD repeat-containing protein
MTAVNSSTTNQTTIWTYGTSLDDSDIATSLLLRSITYPDSVSGSDVVSYASNRQAQRTSLTDQRGCVHQYEYDLLGRPIHDRVTTVGSGVDNAALRLSSAYEVRGMLATLTSWNNTTVGSGSAVNDVLWTYNSFRQSIKTYQSHSGQVNTSTTANVQMGYANGSLNTIRPTTLTYPNGRVLTYSYGTSGSITDASTQVASLIDSNVGATHLADYSYLGLGSVVQQDSPEANLRYTLISLTGTNDPDTGDIYAGLDRFGRVKDCRWRNTSSSTDLSRVKYGYNRDSSRTWRANPTDPNQHYDWLYGYDGLQRLKNGDRGTLNGTNTGIASEQFSQCWTLDSTGNWKGFRQDDDGDGTWDLIQGRSASAANEITAITNSVGSAWVNPAYDPAGNMTTMPQPADPTEGFDAVYDAWNRLVSLADSTSHNTVQQNVYDGRNYRIIRKDYTSGTLSATRNFYYTDGWQDVEERLGTSRDSVSPDQQYVWGVRYIDDVLCRNRSVSCTLDERFYGCHPQPVYRVLGNDVEVSECGCRTTSDED